MFHKSKEKQGVTSITKKMHKSQRRKRVIPKVVFPPPLERGERWVATTTSKEGKRWKTLQKCINPEKKGKG